MNNDISFDEFAELFLSLPTQYCAFEDCAHTEIQCNWRMNGCCTAGSVLPFGDYPLDIFDSLKYAESKCNGDINRKRLFIKKLKQKNEKYYQYFACEGKGQYCENLENIGVFEETFIGANKGQLLPTSSTPQNGTEEKPKAHFNCSLTDEQLTRIYDGLKQGNFIASDSVLSDWLYICKGGAKRTAMAKIVWTAKNMRTRQPSKKSLLDLLVTMGFVEKDIRANINQCFTVKDAGKYTSKDYTAYKDWRKDIKSEHHDTLAGIIKNGKEEQK